MKTVLVTGGSSGIGLEISKRFAQNGYAICWVTLLEDEAQQARQVLLDEYPTTVTYLIQDLSLPDSAQHVIDWVRINNIDVDVLINNAGFATYGYSTDISIEKEVNMINLNVLGVYRLTRLFLADMTAKNKGTIINISSSTSFQPVPRMAAYAATKVFVSHYSQGLQDELQAQGSKVRVMTVCPSAIKDTKFKAAANMDRVKTFEGLTATTANEVADDVWKAFQDGKTFLRTGAKQRQTVWLTKILPKWIMKRMINDELSRA